MNEISVIDLYKKIAQELTGCFANEEIKSLQRIIIEKKLKIAYHQIFLNPNNTVNSSDTKIINEIIEQLKSGRPIQYILGEIEFFGLTIKITPDVLIPRPETEELVDLIIKSTNKKRLTILDIGTGSGCIAIALAKNLPESNVYGIDVSEEALSVAIQNAISNGANIDFSQVNFLNSNEKVDGGLFDLIVSNPPYVRYSETNLMKTNVLDYEPHLALFVNDNNPLLFYKVIAKRANELLKLGGTVFCEINEAFGMATVAVFIDNNFENVKIHKDINGKDRFISAVYGQKG